jgi:hypothetical protein
MAIATLFEGFSNQNSFWLAILAVILVVCSFTRREAFAGAPFIPADLWINYPEQLSDHPGDRLYLAGSNKCFNCKNRYAPTGKTSCFSCEKDMMQRGGPISMGRNGKCFSCESQAMYNYGEDAGIFGQANKCFDCESQYASNPFKEPGSLGGPRDSSRGPPPQGLKGPYCNKRSCDTNYASRFGQASGKSYSDQLSNDGVGLVTGFGRVDGQDDTNGPTQYPLGKM